MSERQKVRIDKQLGYDDTVKLEDLALACDEMEKAGVKPTSITIIDSYESTRYLYLVGERDETDAEMKAREENRLRSIQSKEAQDRLTYERLKRKFEGGK